MDVIKTDIEGVVLIRPKVFKDRRGDFCETFREERYRNAGINCSFVQDNLVHSKKNVFRGLHFQFPPYEQAKLISMIRGEILDIAVDLRRNSNTYLQQVRISMTAENRDQLFIPAGFAHGYYVLSDHACIAYKVSAPYARDHQGGIRWNDPELDLSAVIKEPILSDQDKNLPLLNEVMNKHTF